MTPAELEALVERKLGGMRHLVERQLVGLEERLRPGERLVTVAVASRRLLLGGELLLAATDQRLLVLSRSSHCEELDYDEVISVISAPPAREIAPVSEISLVTRQGVRTLVVMPGACAAEIAAAVAASIGEDRVQPTVGVAEAGRMRRALISLIISACALMGAYVVHVELQGATDGHHRSAGARDRLSKGQCLDPQGFTVACTSAEAVYIVLGARSKRGCRKASASVLAQSLASTDAARREFSRWCVGVNSSER